MERSEALETLRREYQSDYQAEIRAARSLLNHGLQVVEGAEGSIKLNDKMSFVGLGMARKRFLDSMNNALKPILEAYSRELEREAASLGLTGKSEGGDLLMESLHEALRHLQQVDSHPAPRTHGNGHASHVAHD